MSWSLKSVDFVTLFVEDLDRSRVFYQDVWEIAQDLPRAKDS